MRGRDLSKAQWQAGHLVSPPPHTLLKTKGWGCVVEVNREGLTEMFHTACVGPPLLPAVALTHPGLYAKGWQDVKESP